MTKSNHTDLERIGTSRIAERVYASIEHHELLEANQSLYVAVSGGADSVALLAVLRSLGYEIRALHCNFHLRAEESDADEAFVRSLCSHWRIHLDVKHFDTQSYARAQGVSIEMAARTLRYRWFIEMMQSSGISRVAVAHNADDQIETLLLNLSSGTGIRGLSGMPYKRHDGVVRPMMDVSRLQIESFLLEYLPDLAWRYDSTNSDIRYRRNYIRHQIIPHFEQLNPSFRERILRTIDQMRAVEAFYLESINRYKDSVLEGQDILISPLLDSPDAETLLFEILREYGFTSEQCYAIARALPDLPSGRAFYAPSYRLVRSYDRLELLPLNTDCVDVATTAFTLEDLLTGNTILSARIVERDALPEIKAKPNELYLDYDSIKASDNAFVLRPMEQGDVMLPYGMKGRKRISRILIDRKVSHADRQDARLLCLGGDVLWLIGYTTSSLHCVTSDTQLVLIITAD